MKKYFILNLILLCACTLVGKPYNFINTDSIPQPCAGHCSAVLSDGKIFVLGGYSYFLDVFPVASNLIRIYDPSSDTWSCSRVRINTPRMYAATLVLPGDRILIAGGLSQDNKPVGSVEMYLPSLEKSPLETVTCKVIGNLSNPRRNTVLNLIGDNKVLVTGNFGQPEIIEISDTGSCTVRAVQNKMQYPRTEHCTAVLSDGRICFISGRRKSIEIFDPDTESFTLCKSRFKAYFDDQAAVVLNDDRILIVGGQNIYGNTCSCQTWIFDPKADTLTEGRTLTPTADGDIRFGISDLQIVDLFSDIGRPGEMFFLCGGEDDPAKGKDVPLDSAWLYDARSGEFLDVGPMNYPHDDFKVESLPEKDGKLRVLIIGGHSTEDRVTDKCEIFELDKSFFEKG